MKVVYKSGTAGAIYFPPGPISDGGTCEFITKRCRKECMLQSNAAHTYTYTTIIDNTCIYVADLIEKEMKQQKLKVLGWFESGDCELDMTNRIYKIMKLINKSCGIIQHGFTRNKELWERLQNMSRMRMAYTVEDQDTAIELSNEGLISYPDYDTWRTRIVHKGNYVTGCGGGWTIPACGNGFLDMEDEVYEDDCGMCHKHKRGCFVK